MTTPSAVAVCSGPVLVVEHVGTGDVEGPCRCGDHERDVSVAEVIRMLRLVQP